MEKTAEAKRQRKRAKRKRRRAKGREPLGWIARALALRLHPLPDFIIAGAQKAGTTSMYAYLCQHPQIMPAAFKELHFFSDWYRLGEAWYRRQFPTKSRMSAKQSRIGHRVITGEASPSYMFHPHAPARIAAVLPGVKLIVILRNPVARAFSHYRHSVRHKAEKLSFEDAINREEERTHQLRQRLLIEEDCKSPGLQHHSYLSRGVYVDQLKALHQHFKPEQLLIISSDELFNDPQATYSRTLEFLGVKNRMLRNAKPRNVGKYDRSERIPMQDELEAYFRPHNRRLYDYLGRDFGWPADPPPNAAASTSAHGSPATAISTP